jgi:hypothetical protein
MVGRDIPPAGNVLDQVEEERGIVFRAARKVRMPADRKSVV